MPRFTATRSGSVRHAPRQDARQQRAGLASVQIDTRPALAGIESLAPALPGRWYPQDELMHKLGHACDDVARGFFERSEIAGRYLAVDDRELGDLQAGDQHRRLIRAGRELAVRAAGGALAQAGIEPRSIGCLVVASSSGFVMPALSALVASALALPSDICKYDLVGAGCLGALPLLSLASQYLAARPDRRVLGVCVDLGSQYLRRGETDKARIVVNSLFADASVGLVAGAGPSRSAMPQILDVRFRQGREDRLDSATVEVDEGGAKIARLHRELPERSAELFEPLIEEILAANDLDRSAIAHWVLHPGGRAVLDRLQATLALSNDDMVPSRAVLRHYGNASSPTCLLVLHHVIATGRAQPGDHGLVCAIGPGLTAGVALVRWPRSP